MRSAIKRCKQHPDPWDTRGRYVHHAGPRRFEAYYDGYAQSRSAGHKTYRDAARQLFPAVGHGGYDLAYRVFERDSHIVTLCADCACLEWCANPDTEFVVESNDGDSKFEQSTDCDGCSREIWPQCCPECGNAIEDDPCPVFYRDGQDWRPPRLPNFQHAYRIMHARCLAQLVTRGDAIKTGFQEYRVLSYSGASNTGHWASGLYRGPKNLERGYAAFAAGALEMAR